MENRVGFWPRVGASLIDLVIMAVLAFLCAGLVASLLPGAVERALAEATSDPRMSDPKMAGMRDFVVASTRWSIAFGLLGTLYALIEGFTGWTPGKLAVGVRIVSESGQRAPVSRLLLRYLVKNVSGVLTVLGIFSGAVIFSKAGTWIGVVILLGFLLVLGKSRQALHDRLVGTAVLRKSDLAESGAAPTAAPAATT